MFSRLLLPLLILASSQVHATESNWLNIDHPYQRGDIYQPQGWWPFLGAGMGVMDAADTTRSGGLPMQLRALGSYHFDDAPWVADAGMGLHNEILTQEGGGADMITAIYAEFAARYKLANQWQVGGIWNTLVDSAERYHSNNGSLASFMGAQVLKEFVWRDQYLVRAGGRLMTDIGLRGDQINTVMVDLQVGFGPGTKPVQVIETKPAIAPHLAKAAMVYPMEPERLHFETGSTKMTSASQVYLRRLARNLAMNPELFDKLKVAGHTDQRGTKPYNQKLSVRRAKAIADVLISAGLPKSKIEMSGKGKSQLLSRLDNPKSWAKNRRVEFHFSGIENQAALNNIVEAAAH